MREFHRQTIGDKSGLMTSRNRRFPQLLAVIALSTLLLLLIGFVTRSQAQDAAPGAGEAENGLIAFLPFISNPTEVGGTPPVLPNPATDTTIAANDLSRSLPPAPYVTEM